MPQAEESLGPCQMHSLESDKEETPQQKYQSLVSNGTINLDPPLGYNPTEIKPYPIEYSEGYLKPEQVRLLGLVFPCWRDWA